VYKMKKTIQIISICIIIIILMGSVTGNDIFKEKIRTGEDLYTKGNIHYNKKEYIKAKDLYEKAISLGYTDRHVYYKLSICCREIKDIFKSFDYIENAIALLEDEIARKHKNIVFK